MGDMISSLLLVLGACVRTRNMQYQEASETIPRGHSVAGGVADRRRMVCLFASILPMLTKLKFMWYFWWPLAIYCFWQNPDNQNTATIVGEHSEAHWTASPVTWIILWNKNSRLSHFHALSSWPVFISSLFNWRCVCWKRWFHYSPLVCVEWQKQHTLKNILFFHSTHFSMWKLWWDNVLSLRYFLYADLQPYVVYQIAMCVYLCDN